MNRSTSFRLLVLIALAFLVSSSAQAVESSKATKRQSDHYWEITFGYAAWSDLDSLVPDPVDFVAEQSGRFKDKALGIEVAYHRRQADHGKAAFLVGGELAGYGFPNRQSLIGYDAITADPLDIHIESSWGHVTGSVRWLWHAGRKVELLAGGGGGVYMVRFNDVLDDFSIVERGENDATPGGYLMAGLRFPLRSGRVGLRTGVRIHFFSFSDIRGAFEGQDIGGPVTVLNFGIDF